MTNYERIISLNIDEMAEFLNKIDDTCIRCQFCFGFEGCATHSCLEGVKAWLMQEEKEEGND